MFNFTSSALQTQELAATISLHFILLCRDEVETPLVIDLQTVQNKKISKRLGRAFPQGFNPL